MSWLLLILSLPTENATARMRAWRALKACGAGVLRDGVYVLPERDDCRATLEAIGANVRESGGTAYVLTTTDEAARDFVSLFDRNAEFAELLAQIGQSQRALSANNATEAARQARKLRKSFTQLAGLDFFPGEAQAHAGAALAELESAIARLVSPDEPHAQTGEIARLDIADYRGKVWATRKRPWVDRLASAWLIRRFIDPDARFVWISSPDKCPRRALGFDFDGARFSHVGNKVTFETLAASFALDGAAIRRIGAIVHFLDVGGVEPEDARGIERILRGLFDITPRDDQLLELACSIFDGLHAAFQPDSGEQA